MRSGFAFLLGIVFLSVPLCSQSAGTIAIPTGGPHDNVYAQPATLQLVPKAPGAHPGSIWIRSSDEGLLIWGKVQVGDDDLHWPAEKSDMLAGDHVEIWLSASPTVDLPAIGYGNQFGENTLHSAADCSPLETQGDPGSPRNPKIKECAHWYDEQVQYRKLFPRLFTRQWLLAGSESSGPSDHVFEDFASSAWATLSAAFFSDELPKLLQPRDNDRPAVEFGTESAKQESRISPSGAKYNAAVTTGYRFQVLIPWTSFPPAQQLNLRDLWLMVDVFAAAPAGRKMGALSTSAPTRVWGDPSTFNHLVLDVPRFHRISPCRADATEPDMYGNPHPVWYFPMAGKSPLDLSMVYDIENPTGGYMYDPAGVSPGFRPSEHFWKTLSYGAAVCGPQLAWAKGELARSSKFHVEKQYFTTKALPDGWTLVRTGPDVTTLSPFGSGQCGACPVVDFHVYAVSPTGDITPALDIHDDFTGAPNGPDNGDFAIAPDWSRVTFYEQAESSDEANSGQDAHWSATSYCLQGHQYAKCGEEKNAKPPNPPNFNIQED